LIRPERDLDFVPDGTNRHSVSDQSAHAAILDTLPMVEENKKAILGRHPQTPLQVDPAQRRNHDICWINTFADRAVST
jgi:ribosomal protein S7